MTETMTTFDELQAPAPELAQVAEEYRQIESSFDAASDSQGRTEALDRWEALRRRLETWRSLTHLRFHQETGNEEYRRARDLCDEMSPQLTDLEVQLKRKLLATGSRQELEQALGSHAFDLWQCDIASFEPAISDALVEESKLSAEYTELTASAEIQFQGETLNLSELRKYSVDPDRAVRHGAEQVRWQWFASNGEALDRIYDDLVQLRTQMARTLGDDDYVALGYRRMRRTDYDAAAVARFRGEVRSHVVPLCQTLIEHQAQDLGLDRVRFWDEGIHDQRGNPSPQGDHDWLLGQAQGMFDAMGGGLGEFFGLMRQKGLLDLDTRHGKASGGFCTAFPTHGFPFIFANFNGTKGDVEVFTHEMGHAFQCYQSRDSRVFDYLWPTYEACEIHSMGLEFLTWPQMDLFFGDDADRFRRTHLTESLTFLPYGVAVDEFQHRVYSEPDLSPAGRREVWKEIENAYLPWRDYGDLDYPDRGGIWQAQRHIYAAPFYYIDYTLALTCAMQLWVRAEKDRAATMEAYVKLCQRGGEAPFQELAKSAGLISPFESGCLADVVGKAREALGI